MISHKPNNHRILIDSSLMGPQRHFEIRVPRMQSKPEMDLIFFALLCGSYYKYGRLSSFSHPKFRPVHLIECSLYSKIEQFLLNVLFK